MTANLLAEDRKENIKRFLPEDFVRKAIVLMGEPDQAYKTHIHSIMLADKTTKVEAERAKAKAEKERIKAREAKAKPVKPTKAEKKEEEKEGEEKDAEMKDAEKEGE